MVRFICRKLWAWHSCPQSMRKNYKAIAIERLALSATAIGTVLFFFVLLVIHNAML